MRSQEPLRADAIFAALTALTELIPEAAGPANEQATQVEALVRDFVLSTHQALARHQLVFDEAPAPYVVTDGQGRIREANAAARSLLGRGQAELTGVQLVSFVAEDDSDEFERWLERRQSGQTDLRWDATLDLEHGPTPVAISMADGGDEVGLRWIFSDQQMRTAVERHLRDVAETEHDAAGDLRADAQARTAFLIALSHDLRAPIGALVHQAQLLGSEDLSEEIRQRSVETLRENASLLARMMDDLIDIERFAQGELQLDRRPTALSAILDVVVDDGVKVVVEDDEATALVDVDAMSRAIRTLVAAKGRRYPTTPVIVRGRMSDDDIEISVRAESETAPPTGASDASRAVNFRLIGALVEAHDGSMTQVDHGVILRLPRCDDAE